MALPRLITSRAVIHALRGALLTTSCVFVLVSEERRRRLQVACAVVDNARRLHYVRQCLASDAGKGSSPPISNKRRGGLAKKAMTAADKDVTDSPQAVKRLPPSLTADEGRLRTPFTPSVPLHFDQKRAISSVKAEAEPEDQHPRDAIPFAHEFLLTYDHDTIGPLTIDIYPDALTAILKLRMFLEFCSPTPSESAEGIRLAAVILEKLAALGALPEGAVSKLMRASCKLLRIALRLQEEEATTRIITSLLDLCHTSKPLRIFNAIVDSMQKGGSSRYMELALETTTRVSNRLPPRQGNLLKVMLEQQRVSPAGFSGTRRLYEAMLSAGLFTRYKVRTELEYDVRVSMKGMAARAKAHDLVRSEIRALEALSMGDCRSDLSLQRGIAVWEAETQQWEPVFARIQQLEKHVYSDCFAFQMLVKHIVNLFTQKGPLVHLDRIVRGVVDRYGVSLNLMWVVHVMSYYASRREDYSVEAWLDFCGENFRFLGDKACESLLSRCLRYWCFSAKEGAILRRRLEHVRYPHDLRAIDSQSEGMHLKGSTAIVRHAESPTAVGKVPVSEARPVESTEASGDGSCQAPPCRRSEKSQSQVTTILLQHLEAGADPDDIITHALQTGTRVDDRLFRRAARALAESGSLPAAADMCIAASRVNGRGNLLYNPYIFCELVYTYAGIPRYRELELLMKEFQSGVQWWRGATVVKETLKHAMRIMAMRLAAGWNADPSEAEQQRSALGLLGEALEHVRRCRTDNYRRRRLADNMVTMAREVVARETASGRKGDR
ncbi:hypothetical protein GQ602_002833 [Ophiocordyceps camponoti-floridani]|uniref:Uncharacterized protein n=1 Tax=Ophiocordyceps camponoti-floridani TaxID=2030778 RepID=A0A8H4QB47_9HYPO|nr:hypothetical protein GQ602_002833 [Ophiocordyceps camponoti-floridani]